MARTLGRINRLVSKHIFLDTNIFEENNFFQGSNIQSIFNYSKVGVIQLYLTEISRMELIHRMSRKLQDINEDTTRLISQINKVRILKNLPEYASIEKTPVNIDRSLSKLKSKLSLVISTNKIRIIDGKKLDADSIFKDHFNLRTPFNNSNGKQNEFADAFILKSVETWCKKNRHKIIFVTKDTNFKGYKSKHVFFKSDLAELLESITKNYDEQKQLNLIPKIEEAIEYNKEALKEMILQKLDDLVVIDNLKGRISKSKRSINLIDYKITSIRTNYAEINYNIEVLEEFNIFTSINDIIKFQFEDNFKPTTRYIKYEVTCDLEVDFTRNKHVELKWVNSNQKIWLTITENV